MTKTISRKTVHGSPTPKSERLNVADWLARRAAERPDQAAIVLSDPRTVRRARRDRLTFAELERECNRVGHGLTRLGIERGTRTLVMVKPGFEFFSIVFALFKIGAVPVMIDRGMGVARLVECVRSLDLQAFIGIPLAHVVRVLRPGGFRGVTKLVTVGARWGWGGATLDEIMHGPNDDFTPAQTQSTDTAAILFTSGSTGPAKGVVYEHGMFDAQIRMIQAHYAMQPGEIDVPTFPLFALFSLAMGMTIVIPEMDASRPARADPQKIVRAIQEHGATNSFGSPALWRNVADHCLANSVRLSTLRRVLIAGAPVSLDIIDRLLTVLSPDADVFTPYGATEALPVASIGGRERIALRRQTAANAGTCVGRSLPDAQVRLIRVTDEAVPSWSDDLLVEDGQVGEICVAGPMVTKAYHALPEATERAKTRESDRIWHRMGDVGYQDAEGRLWYCGRKSQRVVTSQGTLWTDCCEGVFNQHPDVARSALVGVGPRDRQTLVIIIEPKPGRFPRGRRAGEVVREILELCQSTIDNQQSTIAHVLFRRCLPVDIRHNAKINREALASWAARRMGRA